MTAPNQTSSSAQSSADKDVGSGPSAKRNVKIGLALGAGAARGWAHIGVLRELLANGLYPDVIAGTSMGAVVGGCYAAGKLDQIEVFARSLTRRRVFTLMDLSFTGGSLIAGERLKVALEQELSGFLIEQLETPFAAIATEVGTGHEVWLQRGSLSLAIRASYALPGIFEPVRVADRWLFDGALVNPVPVTVCRALGADFVIAINVTADMMYRAGVIRDAAADMSKSGTSDKPYNQKTDASLIERILPKYFDRRSDEAPNVGSAMIDAFNIIQDRILRSRLAGDPPDAIITAHMEDIGMFDFHRAEKIIEIGHIAATRALPNIFSYLPIRHQAR